MNESQILLPKFSAAKTPDWKKLSQDQIIYQSIFLKISWIDKEIATMIAQILFFGLFLFRGTQSINVDLKINEVRFREIISKIQEKFQKNCFKIP